MLAQLTAPPSNGFEQHIMLALYWLITTAISGWIGYRWGLRSQIEAKKLDVKDAMFPLIEKFIERAKKEEFFGLWTDSRAELVGPAMRLKHLMRGGKQRLFLESWERFYNTTKDELHHPQPNETPEKIQEMKRTIISRLEALKKAVQ
jgi:hypothetical protein